MHWINCIKSQGHYFERDDADYMASVVGFVVVVVVKFGPKTTSLDYIHHHSPVS
jgi:hypothetical protein